MTITDLLAEIEQTNPEDIYERFEQAWEAIMAEPLPVGQWNRHIPATNTAPHRYRACIDAEAYESAALILMWPFEFEAMNPDSIDGRYCWTMTNIGYLEGKHMQRCGATIHHPLSSGGGPMVSAFFETPGMAMLIAVLKAHEKWGK